MIYGLYDFIGLWDSPGCRTFKLISCIPLQIYYQFSGWNRKKEVWCFKCWVVSCYFLLIIYLASFKEFTLTVLRFWLKFEILAVLCRLLYQNGQNYQLTRGIALCLRPRMYRWSFWLLCVWKCVHFSLTVIIFLQFIFFCSGFVYLIVSLQPLKIFLPGWFCELGLKNSLQYCSSTAQCFGPILGFGTLLYFSIVFC